MADQIVTMKRCPKCGIEKPFSEFGKNVINRRGLLWACRPCAKDYATAYRAAHRERVRFYHAKWLAENPERHKANRSAYRDIALEQSKARRKADPDYDRNYRYANAKAIKARTAAYQQAHTKEARDRARLRRKNFPDKVNATHQTRRARQRSAEGSFAAADVQEIRRLQRDRCAACRIGLKGKGDIDHIVALASGGSNQRRNIQLLCHPCNSSKQARHPTEFMQSRGFLI